MAGTFLLITLYLQLVVGLSPLHAGLWLVPMNAAMVASTMLAPQLARRFRPAAVMGVGLVIAAAGLLLITQVDVTGGLPVLVTGFTLACVGIALPTALGVNLIMGSVPPEKAGSASGVSETSGEFGIALGVAVLGSLGTAVFRAKMQLPSGLSADAGRTAAESIGGALSVANDLPAGMGADLIASARAAFTVGLNVAGVVGAVVLSALAVVSVTAFRHIAPTGATVPDGEEYEDSETFQSAKSSR
jgi:MFS transporter, DHA2 family, multidrug resistance protein